MSLLEIIITIGIFSIMLAAFGQLFFSNQFLLIDNQNTFEAILRAKFLLEKSTAALKDNFYAPVATSSQNGVFKETIQSREWDNFTKEIESELEWFVNGRRRNVNFRQLVSNFREAVGIGDCQLDGNENWQSPSILNGPDLGFGNQTNGVFGLGDKVYLAVDNKSPRDPAADKNTFFIVDVVNPATPVIISKLNTGPGLSSVVVAGHYAYVGNKSINAQLQVIDVGDPYNPSIVVNYKLPGTYTDGTTIPNTLFYHLGKIYLGTAKSQIEELHIIDVENPLLPHEIGRWEVGAGINSILVTNHYSYIASPLAGEELMLLDVLDPSHIRKITTFNAPAGTSIGAGHGKSLVRDRTKLYLGRTVGETELFALDITNPESLIATGSLVVSDSINAMAATVNRIYFGTNNKFEILNSENHSAIVPIKIIDLPNKVTGISCSGKNIFVSNLSNIGFKIIQPAQ